MPANGRAVPSPAHRTSYAPFAEIEQQNLLLRRAIENHISWCWRCCVVFDTTGKTLKIVLDVEPFEVPLAVSARLYARLEEVLSES
jgi:hypothetical protein